MPRAFAWTQILLLPAIVAAAPRAESLQADVCIYGGTSGGVIAAVQVARMGKRAVILEPGAHLGGMSAGGLGWTDFANKGAVGGMARDFYRRVGAIYGKPEEFNLEPHVAEQVFNDLAKTGGVTVRLQRHLKAVRKSGAAILEIATEERTSCRAPMFIDATYEGDLLAKAGVDYIVGRESNAQYHETLNGVQGPAVNPRAGKFEVRIDPWRTPGDPKSGPLPYLLQDEPLSQIGSADHRVQAYNYRVCLTDREDNRIAILPPKTYDPAQFELLARWIEARVARGDRLQLSDFLKFDPLPNGKFDFNNRWPISTDFLGGSTGYPEASWPVRARICRAHEDYLRGFFRFLATGPQVPEAVRREMARFGLAKDEFTSTGGWPHQIYVREARRMISAYVMTEHHANGEEAAPKSVGLAAYGIDIHAARRIVVDDQPVNEGSNGAAVPRPYPIAYDSIVPKREQCRNLLVPFCLSASHIGFASIRMEPVFMVLSQSAAIAAVMAMERHAAIQDVEYDPLRRRMIEAGQVLDWPAK